MNTNTYLAEFLQVFAKNESLEIIAEKFIFYKILAENVFLAKIL